MTNEEERKDRVISRTHFEKRPSERGRRQWYWRTESGDRTPLGASDEGYNQLPKAISSFFRQQQEPGWDSDAVGMQGMPDGYALQKIDSDHYVITRVAK